MALPTTGRPLLVHSYWLSIKSDTFSSVCRLCQNEDLFEGISGHNLSIISCFLLTEIPRGPPLRWCGNPPQKTCGNLFLQELPRPIFRIIKRCLPKYFWRPLLEHARTHSSKLWFVCELCWACSIFKLVKVQIGHLDSASLWIHYFDEVIKVTDVLLLSHSFLYLRMECIGWHKSMSLFKVFECNRFRSFRLVDFTNHGSEYNPVLILGPTVICPENKVFVVTVFWQLHCFDVTACHVLGIPSPHCLIPHDTNCLASAVSTQGSEWFMK